jgi:hypothetical protein
MPLDHNVSYAQHKSLADAACWMIHGLLFLCQSFVLHYCNRNSVSKDHLKGCGSDRCEVVGTELPLQWQADCQIACFIQRRFGNAADGRKLSPFRPGIWDKSNQLLRVATL